ncbi:MAG: hypothetical protein CW338_09800 [Clostridiales bacterium]|nr:hypothetical protein [Clostridiales bacterium]
MKKITALILAMILVFSIIPCASAGWWDDLTDSLGGVWDSVSGTVANVWDSVSGFVSDNAGKIADISQRLWTDFKGTLAALSDKASDVYQTLAGWLETADDSMIDSLKGIFFSLLENTGLKVTDRDAFWQTIKDSAAEYKVSLTSVVKAILPHLGELYNTYGRNALSSWQSGSAEILDKVGGWLEEAGVLAKEEAKELISKVAYRLGAFVEQ